MTIQEIKSAIDAGKTVYWKNPLYRVVKDSKGQYLISSGTHFIGLTWEDGETLNGKPEDFFIKEKQVPAKLVFVGCPPEQSLLVKYNAGAGLGYSNGKATLAGFYFKPILISETDKIEVGDYFFANQGIHKCVRVDNNTSCPYITINDKGEEIGHFHTWRTKILALPKHFSPKHLQAIVDGKLKDGDKVLVELNGKAEDFFIEIVEVYG